LFNRQSENINNPSLLYLAVSFERGLFFKIMERYFLEFVNNKNLRVLIDTADIKFIQEGGEQSEGYCKIYFYSSPEISEWIKEDYDSLIEKLKNYYKNLNN